MTAAGRHHHHGAAFCCCAQPPATPQPRAASVPGSPAAPPTKPTVEQAAGAWPTQPQVPPQRAPPEGEMGSHHEPRRSTTERTRPPPTRPPRRRYPTNVWTWIQRPWRLEGEDAERGRKVRGVASGAGERSRPWRPTAAAREGAPASTLSPSLRSTATLTSRYPLVLKVSAETFNRRSLLGLESITAAVKRESICTFSFELLK
jgi:hypothetical protein